MTDNSQSIPNPSSAPEGKEKNVQIKLVLLGESAVGKSSLAVRFSNNDFKENTEPTIGSAFLTQKIRLDEKTIKFEIWDTAGQERFSSLAPMYYRNAQASIVVYDITKPSSFQKAKQWVHELTHQASPNVVIALAGNKCDLAGSQISEAEGEADQAEEDSANTDSPNEGRKVSFEEASQYATELGLIHFETSAKTGHNVIETFTEIAKKLPLDSILPNRSSRSSGLNSGNGRIDLLREGGGAGAFGLTNDRDSEAPFGAKQNGCC